MCPMGHGKPNLSQDSFIVSPCKWTPYNKGVPTVINESKSGPERTPKPPIIRCRQHPGRSEASLPLCTHRGRRLRETPGMQFDRHIRRPRIRARTWPDGKFIRNLLNGQRTWLYSLDLSNTYLVHGPKWPKSCSE